MSAFVPTSEQAFLRVCDALMSALGASEHLSIELKAEDSLFLRFNRARVRQSGRVHTGELTLLLVLEGDGGALREGSATVSVTGDGDRDVPAALAALEALRTATAGLPVSPWARLPEAGESTRSVTRGDLLLPERAADALLLPALGLDLAGILASGRVVRATANSRGQRHWFEADTFSLDHSAYAPNGAAHKDTYAGSRWEQARWESYVARARATVSLLERPKKVLTPGEYRVWLAPSAVNEIVSMLSWGCIGEGAVRQGDSPLRHVRSGTQRFSPRLSLSEDFRSGAAPRFSSEGDVSPEVVSLVASGELVSTLVSSRSAREYGVPSNGAETSESMRAPAIAPGGVDESEVYRVIGTGLYIPNLWYLNWSDQSGGRITGMTRYACLWIEDGKPVGPIEHLRFDDSIFRILGSSLEDLGREVHVVPDVLSYEFRAVSALATPGLLLSSMAFTL